MSIGLIAAIVALITFAWWLGHSMAYDKAREQARTELLGDIVEVRREYYDKGMIEGFHQGVRYSELAAEGSKQRVIEELLIMAQRGQL